VPSFFHTQIGDGSPTDVFIVTQNSLRITPFGYKSAAFPNNTLYRTLGTEKAATCSGLAPIAIAAHPFGGHQVVCGFSGNVFPGRFNNAEVDVLLRHFKRWRGCPITPREFEAAVDDAIAACQSHVQGVAV
jgi:hypothetical protein